MPPVVTPSDTIEPPTVAMAALERSHYFAERATVWKRRFAWAFMAGAATACAVMWAVQAL